MQANTERLPATISNEQAGEAGGGMLEIESLRVQTASHPRNPIIRPYG